MIDVLEDVADEVDAAFVAEPEDEIAFEDEPEDPDAGIPAIIYTPPDAHLPVQLDHLMIGHIISITNSLQFRSMFIDFEEQVEAKLVPLKSLLRKVIMTQEIQQIEAHAAHVERWRSDCTRFLSLATGFVEHGRSSSFLFGESGGKKVRILEMDAFRRTLTAGYAALALRLEGLVDDIDSRVNLCKKFSDNEKAGFKNFGGRVN